MIPIYRSLVINVAFLAAIGTAHGAGKLKPYILAWQGEGDLGKKTSEIKETLKKSGFRVVGEYAPHARARILAITNNTLRAVAARSSKGGFGAVQRVSITRVGKQLQVAYTNPTYWSAAFRMWGNLSSVSSALKKALGNQRDFGSEGLTPSELMKYHYKVLMPYFTDQDEIGSYASYKEAIQSVKAGLAARKGGTKLVYGVKIPGKQETVFGVQMTRGCSAEKHLTKKIDYARLRATPWLPYQILVSGDKAYALRGRFRIAVSFPDLSMSTFMQIFCAPGAIKEALEAVANPNKD